MSHEEIVLSTLDSLYILHSECVRADASAIARRIGTRPTRVAEALIHLGKKGLVEAETARLTMEGLAIAAALNAARTTGSVAA